MATACAVFTRSGGTTIVATATFVPTHVRDSDAEMANHAPGPGLTCSNPACVLSAPQPRRTSAPLRRAAADNRSVAVPGW